MFRNLNKEELFLIFVSFSGAILISRIFIYFYSKINSIGPAIFIDETHIHHYIIGTLLVLISISSYYLFNLRRNFLQLVLLGVGAGLLCDEFSFWFFFRASNYWSVENFLVVLFVAFLASILIFFKNDDSSFALRGHFKNRHINPENPLISIVIPAFNEESFIANTLSSAVNQSFEDFELIVVDNNSSDRTAEIARSFGAKVICEPKRGVGFARQRGFLEAKGDIVATTDADTVLPLDWLSRISEEFKHNSNLVAFGGLYNFLSGSLIVRLAIRYLSYPIWFLDRLLLRGWSLPGANSAIRKDAFLKVGGFRTELNFREDADISQRLEKIGKVTLDPNFRVQTSGRRFKNGLLRGSAYFIPSWVARLVSGREVAGKLPTIRSEKTSLSKLAFVPWLCLIILFFSLFYFSNPTIANAKGVTQVRNGIFVFEDKIEKSGRGLKVSAVSFGRKESRLLGKITG